MGFSFPSFQIVSLHSCVDQYSAESWEGPLKMSGVLSGCLSLLFAYFWSLNSSCVAFPQLSKLAKNLFWVSSVCAAAWKLSLAVSWTIVGLNCLSFFRHHVPTEVFYIVNYINKLCILKWYTRTHTCTRSDN